MSPGPAGVLGVCLLAPAVGAVPGDTVAFYEGRVTVIEPDPVAVGARGELSVVLLEGVEAGVALSLSLSSEAVGLPENRLSWRDVVDPQAAQLRLRGGFVAPTRAGRYRVDGLVSYVRCEGAWCRTKHAAVAWTVVVTEPSPAR